MASAPQTIIISTSDEEQFTVEKKVIERSALIKSMMEGELPFVHVNFLSQLLQQSGVILRTCLLICSIRELLYGTLRKELINRPNEWRERRPAP